MTSLLCAQTFEDGYQSYMRNQFPVAELQFKTALKKAKSKEDMAFILKFIGICQYMRGDKKQAATTFQQAIANDTGISIDEEEVLDPSIVPFFNFLKTRWIKEHPAGAPALTPAPPVAAAIPPAPLPPVKNNPALAAKPSLGQAPAAVKTVPKPKKKLAKSIVASNDSSAETEKEPAKPGRKLSLFHFLPFGSGQFYNGSPWWGSSLALIQVFNLYQYQALAQQIKERQALDLEVANNSALSDPKKEAFYRDNQTFMKKLQSNQQLQLGLFVGLWIGGAVEAVWHAPTESSNSPSPGLPIPQERAASQAETPRLHYGGSWLPDGKQGMWLVQLQLPL